MRLLCDCQKKNVMQNGSTGWQSTGNHPSHCVPASSKQQEQHMRKLRPGWLGWRGWGAPVGANTVAFRLGSERVSRTALSAAWWGKEGGGRWRGVEEEAQGVRTAGLDVQQRRRLAAMQH